MDTKQILRIIIWTAIISLLISLVPIGIYWCHFKHLSFSDKPGDWGTFGDFVGGVSGTFLTFLAVLFSLTSLYFTSRVSKQIQDNEFGFNEKQSKKQLETLHQQNKPFPFLHLSRYNKRTAVIVQNMGLGPLIIKRWKVVYNEQNEYKSFRHLLEKMFLNPQRRTIVEYNSSSEHVLAPNCEKRLLRVRPDGEADDDFEKDHKELRAILNKTEVFIDYEDIFGNRFELRKKLDFFH